MDRKVKLVNLKSALALMILSGVLVSACDILPSDTASQSSAELTQETTVLPETTTTTAPESSETSETTTETTAETTAESTVTSDTSSSDDSGEDTLPSDESAEGTDTDVGYGSYGFLRGNIRFHSQNDISMMIEPEDATIYDYGARNVSCHWIDVYYVEDSFDMNVLDYSYRFLSFYNEDTSVNFSGYKEIGNWKTPKGSELKLYIAEITIISDNLEIRILPKDPGKPENYTVSINGRGYYVSEEQLQMADFVLSSLMENPGTDPLEGIINGVNHTYYF